MRGEHSDSRLQAVHDVGSPPHARGTPLEDAMDNDELRITPACAGNTVFALIADLKSSHHPRMRGEHSFLAVILTPALGSPPHARGTRCVDLDVCAGTGITPACAGNTHIGDNDLLKIQDHPRMRGEHSVIVFFAAVHTGSPPHARGTLAGTNEVDAALRITPACAGNTPYCI